MAESKSIPPEPCSLLRGVEEQLGRVHSDITTLLQRNLEVMDTLDSITVNQNSTMLVLEGVQRHLRRRECKHGPDGTASSCDRRTSRGSQTNMQQVTQQSARQSRRNKTASQVPDFPNERPSHSSSTQWVSVKVGPSETGTPVNKHVRYIDSDELSAHWKGDVDASHDLACNLVTDPFSEKPLPAKGDLLVPTEFSEDSDATVPDEVSFDSGSTAGRPWGSSMPWFLPANWPANLKLKFVDSDLQHDASVRLSQDDCIAKAIKSIKKSAKLTHNSTGFTKSSFSTSANNFFVLHPISPARMILDFFSVALLAHDMVVTPYSLAWGSDLNVISITWTSLIFWSVEILFNFRTGYYENGELEMRPQTIARHYSRTWFMLDVITVLGDWSRLLVSILVHLSGIAGIVEFGRLVKASRLLKLLGLLRMSRLSQHLERINDRFFTEVLSDLAQIVVLILVIVWLNHLLACLWFAISHMPTDTGVHWVDARVDNVFFESYTDTPELFQYATSLHWAMTQMTPGSMPVQPLNSLERFFNFACLVFGMIVFSSIVSSLSSRMTHLRMNRNKHYNQLQTVSRYLRERLVSRNLSTTVRKQVEDRIWQKRPLVMQDIEPLSLLSLQLRRELDVEINKEQVMSHAFFRMIIHLEQTLLAVICTKATEKILLPRDILFTPGLESEDFFRIRSGTMHYTRANRLSAEPQYVEDGWLCWPAMWSYWTTVGTTEALGVCEIMSLRVSDVLEVLQSNPVVKSLALDYALAFHARLVKALPPIAAWPDDVQVAFSDHAEIVLSMAREKRILIGLLAMSVLRTARHWSSGGGQNVRLLEQEVHNGASVLIENAKGKVERIVAVVAVHLMKGPLMLAQLAELVGGVLEPSVKLLGGKRAEMEPPREAVDRILKDKLSAFCEAVFLERSEHFTEHKESARFMIPTTYARTVYFGTLDETFAWPAVQRVVYHEPHDTAHAFRLSPSHQPRLPDVDECFLTSSGGRTCLYGWVECDLFEFFKSATGSKVLQEKWLSGLEV